MNSVPGVITFESNLNSAPIVALSSIWVSYAISALIFAYRFASSSISLAALKRRALYWFILARGATPSIAK
jgi:hypothetical protein